MEERGGERPNQEEACLEIGWFLFQGKNFLLKGEHPCVVLLSQPSFSLLGISSSRKRATAPYQRWIEPISPQEGVDVLSHCSLVYLGRIYKCHSQPRKLRWQHVLLYTEEKKPQPSWIHVICFQLGLDIQRNEFSGSGKIWSINGQRYIVITSDKLLQVPSTKLQHVLVFPENDPSPKGIMTYDRTKNQPEVSGYITDDTRKKFVENVKGMIENLLRQSLFHLWEKKLGNDQQVESFDCVTCSEIEEQDRRNQEEVGRHPKLVSVHTNLPSNQF